MLTASMSDFQSDRIGSNPMLRSNLYQFSRVTVNYRPVGEHRRPSEINLDTKKELAYRDLP